MKLTRLLLAITLAFACGVGACETPEAQARKELVSKFVAAFNAQDAAAMASMVSDDVEWFSVSGKDIASEANGRQQLTTSMVKYFASCPSCRSELAQVSASKDRLVTVEVASWQSKTGRKEQQGIAVYEFAGSLIRRVYYFPAEK
jgi:uncharacterized protein (TIGR02246 family)